MLQNDHIIDEIAMEVSIDISTARYPDTWCLVDWADFQKLNSLNARAFARKVNGSIQAFISCKGYLVSLVRMIRPHHIHPKLVVMHRNHNKLDCRLDNLVSIPRRDISLYRRPRKKKEAT